MAYLKARSCSFLRDSKTEMFKLVFAMFSDAPAPLASKSRD